MFQYWHQLMVNWPRSPLANAVQLMARSGRWPKKWIAHFINVSLLTLGPPHHLIIRGFFGTGMSLITTSVGAFNTKEDHHRRVLLLSLLTKYNWRTGQKRQWYLIKSTILLLMLRVVPHLLILSRRCRADYCLPEKAHQRTTPDYNHRSLTIQCSGGTIYWVIATKKNIHSYVILMPGQT